MAFVQAPPAYSDDLAGKQTLQVSIGIGAMDFDYRESNNGERLNHEQGNLFGLTASAHKVWGKHFVEADIAWFGNAVDYRGQTQNGVPVTTTTDQNIADSGALYGRYFQLPRNFQHALVAGLGYRYWRRDIRSTNTAQGVLEHYSWWYGQAGWQGIYQPTARSNWLAEVTLLRPFAAKVDIDFGNDFDTTSLKLGEKNGVQLELTYQFRPTNTWRVNIQGVYATWNIGRSREATLRRNGAAIGQVFEPASETHSASLTISGIYAF